MACSIRGTSSGRAGTCIKQVDLPLKGRKCCSLFVRCVSNVQIGGTDGTTTKVKQ